MSLELDDLVAPPARPGFREELWERAASQDRSLVRRWRTLAVISLTFGTAAASAAGVLAFGGGGAAKAIDRTVSCPIPIQGGVPAFEIGTGPSGRTFYSGKWHAYPGFMGISIGPQAAPLIGVSSGSAGYVLDQSLCARATRIPLTRERLPAPTIIKSGDPVGYQLDDTCLSAATIAIRLHVQFGRGGVPAEAQMAVKSGKRLKPIAFIDWTPKRVSWTVSADNCHPRH